MNEELNYEVLIRKELEKFKGERAFNFNETCSYCSSDKLVNNGSCKVCLECGTTTGCS